MSGLSPPNFYQRDVLSQLWGGVSRGLTSGASGQGGEGLHEKVGSSLSFRPVVHAGRAGLCDSPTLDQLWGPVVWLATIHHRDREAGGITRMAWGKDYDRQQQDRGDLFHQFHR